MIGVRLVPQLVVAGHEVAGMTRSPGKLYLLRDLGSEPCVHVDEAARRTVPALDAASGVVEVTED